ncbi:mechanosensitive ion channel family protein [Bizionia gelidisalsuginis]|uniref:Mechanosensitive ion channel family protein n=2 Tax=Bizionia TaxID=283785 RepID=A0A8H2LJ37_9FLAO|nr:MULTISPECIES: mechanosensitive ion channel family protein [Bizionia]TYB78155.1 mechanosensitive ion channel family protein [Bizionia saleffrena]TYC12081.1 mechanosensitive ion channel family protein [Bizionia gelidisalsuginis]
MRELIELFKTNIIAIIGIIVSVITLCVITNVLHKWSVKKEKERFPGETERPFIFIKHILNTLWIVLGVLALSLVFMGDDYYDYILTNFKLVLYVGMVAVLTIIGGTLTNLWFKRSIKNKILYNEDPTAFKFIRYVAVFSVYFVGFLLVMLVFPSLRGVSQTALGGAGVIALIAGVASQEALSNLVGGIFIISFKPFKIGDVVRLSDTMVGTVTDITLRHTIIRNYENKMIVIPNAIINKEKLINYDLGELKCCEHIEIGISYDSDIDLAKKILQEECGNHPLIFDNRTLLDKKEDKPVIRVALTKLNDSSMTIRAWAWASTYTDSFNLKCDVLESVKKRFDLEGIEIPFPYRTIVMKTTADKSTDALNKEQ